LSNRRVVIIGGGVIGLSAAEHLSRKGIRTVLLDKGSFAQEASWAGAGYVDLRDACRVGGAFMDLCRLSYDLYPEWTERLKKESGIDPEFLHSGGIGLAFQEGEEKAFREMEEKTAARGLKGEWFTGREARKWEPALSTEVKSAWFLPQTRQVRPPRLNRALLRVLQNRGVEFRENEEVQEILQEGGKASGVETSRGKIDADKVLLT